MIKIRKLDECKKQKKKHSFYVIYFANHVPTPNTSATPMIVKQALLYSPTDQRCFRTRLIIWHLFRLAFRINNFKKLMNPMYVLGGIFSEQLNKNTWMNFQPLLRISFLFLQIWMRFFKNTFLLVTVYFPNLATAIHVELSFPRKNLTSESEFVSSAVLFSMVSTGEITQTFLSHC